jgi:hypothetical protein
LNKSRYVLALDPSGSYQEGLGTTGWCLYDIKTRKIVKFGFIHAGDYSCQFQYWDAHVKLIDSLSGFHPDVVLEDYLLYGERSSNQINSRLETPQLLGILKYEIWQRGLFVYMQTAMQVKTRWKDELLERKELINTKGNKTYIGTVAVSNHIKDSVRHAIHYATYNSKYKGGDREYD